MFERKYIVLPFMPLFILAITGCEISGQTNSYATSTMDEIIVPSNTALNLFTPIITIYPTQTMTIEITSTQTKLPGLGHTISSIKAIYEGNNYSFSSTNDVHGYPAIIGETYDRLYYITLAGTEDVLFISSFG